MRVSPESLPTGRAIPQSRLWFSLARFAWLILAALQSALYVALTPPRYAYWFDVSADDAQALARLGILPQWYATSHLAAEFLAFSVFAAIAFFLWLKARDWVVLLSATFLLVYLGPSGNGANDLQAWAIEGLSALAAALNVLLFVFPDGRFVPRWTRYVGWAWVGLQLARLAGVTLDPNFLFAPSHSDGITFVVEVVFALTGLYAQVYRYRYAATPAQKQQTKWVVYGLAILIGGFVLAFLPGYAVPALGASGTAHVMMTLYTKGMLLLTRVALPITLAFAVLRYRLWDIDFLINRTLVYGALSAAVIGMYVLLVGILGTMLNVGNNLVSSLLVTGLIAVLFQPLRARLQRGVNRLMYGERDDPYAVLQKLGQRLETTLAPEAVLPAIVETVAQALKLPYAAITWQDGASLHVAAETGTVGASSGSLPISIPLTYQNESVGTLVLAPRVAGEEFTQADKKLLDDFGRQASVAVHAVRLDAALKSSRERLVTAREEERRRIRRDLHDGLGPQLATLAMEADTAREYVRTDPAKTDLVLQEITAHTQTALQDIRRLVYNLRPPALDDLGLVGALNEYVSSLEHNLSVALDAPDTLPPLPAAVEVAAYRIVQEALTNVIKHAHAAHCRIHLRVNSDLYLEIQDDGIGLPQAYTRGVGLASMRERTAELGGSFSIERAQDRGTVIRAMLPMQPDI